MATSSITANFAIHDEKEAKSFISALLSESRSMVPPARKRNWKLVGSVREIERRRSRTRAKIRDFYKSCAFEEFKMPSDADDGSSLGQMFCFLND